MSAPLPLSRKLLYAALLGSLLLGIVAGGLELALRVAGYGHSPRFFRTATAADGSAIIRENRDALAPYFPRGLIRRPQAFRLPAKKAPGTIRIFVLGSSAAMGDPEPAFSLARVLDVMLHAAYPGQRFEVVNAAVTAINSHVVRDIAADCAQLEPDLFIVYEGNNEVIGPFGPAGVLAPFLRSETAIRAAVALKRTRTGQLLANLGRRGSAPAEWGGMQLFLQQQIGADDPRLESVRAHFRANLAAIADEAREAGATALFSTVVTNQRDFAPFLSGTGPAEQTFQEGRQAVAAGRDAEAQRLLQQALDSDLLRFRTDSRLNQVIRDLATGESSSLQVVDTAALVAAQSPHGVTGNEFLYEHVHLTLRGTHAVAATLFPAIVADLTRRGLVSGPVPAPLAYAEIGPRLGYNTYEQAMIAAELLHRFGQPPFTAQSDHATRFAAWQRAASQGQALLARPDATDALREINRRALAGRPDDWILARNTGAMLLSRQLPAEALPLLAQADRWIDDDIDTLVALGWTHRALGHAAEAEAAFARARKLEPDYPNLPPAP